MRATFLTAIVVAAISIATPALAFRPAALGAPSSVEQAKDNYKWKNGGCKYEYKADKKGFKEKYECK